jgi:DNA-binding NarL/FixJ family response regulator
VLTAAEARVLELISLGLTEREIAGRLCVSTSTVHTHVKSIFRKLHVNNKVSAAVWYVRHEPVRTFQRVDGAPLSARSFIRLLSTEDQTSE